VCDKPATVVGIELNWQHLRWSTCRSEKPRKIAWVRVPDKAVFGYARIPFQHNVRISGEVHLRQNPARCI